MELIDNRMTDMAITGMLCGSIIAGLMLTIDIKRWISGFRAHRRLSARSRAGRPESRMDRHLRQLLQSTAAPPLSPAAFKTAAAAIFLVVLTAGIRNIAPAAALLAAAAIAGMPYLLLRIKLEAMRSRGSYEGETLVSNLLTQYRIRHLNILETIEGVIKDTAELKTTRKLLFRLLVSLRTAGSEAAAKEALQLFSFAIDTNWSRMLANNIMIASVKGIDVSTALEDILIQLREARTIAEERKRLNSEAVRMTIFMVPVMYASTIMMSLVYLDLPAKRFIVNQFCTEEGFTLFLMVLILFLVNVMLIEMVRNQRFDF